MKWEIWLKIFIAEVNKNELQAEGGLSLDLEPADKEPKKQKWLFWNMKYFFHFNQFGLF